MFLAAYTTAPNVEPPPITDEACNSTQSTSRQHRNWFTLCFRERKVLKETNGPVKIPTALPPETCV